MKLAVISDFVEEQWPSMDLVADEFIAHAAELPGMEVERIRPRMLAPFTRMTGSRAPALRNADRASGRYVEYSLRILAERRRFQRFHVVDHSYAHLALLLPGEHTGVYCHDIDAFRPLFEGRAAGWRKVLANTLLAGLKRASVVFYSTESVRAELEERRILPAERLVHAPYGVAREFRPGPSPFDRAVAEKRPYVLHVGSLIARKNPEFLLRLVAALQKLRPELRFVQVGGEFTPDLERLVTELGLSPNLERLRGLSRDELAALYRNSEAVLLPSLAEGFGLPLIEALSCGAKVVASDIAVFREVGGTAPSFCAVSDLDGWRASVLAAMADTSTAKRSHRLEVAATYSWRAHAETIVKAHERAARLSRARP
jgi:glycosyltransferase involved in cell wall biosynthesis